MCLWSDGGKIPRIYGVPKGNRGKPRQNPGHYGDGATKKCEGSQSLNGKIATLNRFVSRVTDKCLPFFRTLKRSFEWTTECQQAFEELKAYLSSPPLLSPSQPGEELFLYLAISLQPSVLPYLEKKKKYKSPCTTRVERFAVLKKDTHLWKSLPLH